MDPTLWEQIKHLFSQFGAAGRAMVNPPSEATGYIGPPERPTYPRQPIEREPSAIMQWLRSERAKGRSTTGRMADAWNEHYQREQIQRPGGGPGVGGGGGGAGMVPSPGAPAPPVAWPPQFTPPFGSPAGPQVTPPQAPPQAPSAGGAAPQQAAPDPKLLEAVQKIRLPGIAGAPGMRMPVGTTDPIQKRPMIPRGVPRSGFERALDSLFGSQNAESRNQALLQAGLSLLGGSGEWSRTPVSLGSQLAGAIQAGQGSADYSEAKRQEYEDRVLERNKIMEQEARYKDLQDKYQEFISQPEFAEMRPFLEALGREGGLPFLAEKALQQPKPVERWDTLYQGQDFIIQQNAATGELEVHNLPFHDRSGSGSGSGRGEIDWGEIATDAYKESREIKGMLPVYEDAMTLLSSGSVNSGQFGEVRQVLLKTLDDLGVPMSKEVRDSESATDFFDSLTAGLTGDVIKLFGAGNAISDADREFAKVLAGGKRTLTPRALQYIMSRRLHFKMQDLEDQREVVMTSNIPDSDKQGLLALMEQGQRHPDLFPEDAKQDEIRIWLEGGPTVEQQRAANRYKGSM